MRVLRDIARVAAPSTRRGLGRRAGVRRGPARCAHLTFACERWGPFSPSSPSPPSWECRCFGFENAEAGARSRKHHRRPALGGWAVPLHLHLLAPRDRQSTGYSGCPDPLEPIAAGHAPGPRLLPLLHALRPGQVDGERSQVFAVPAKLTLLACGRDPSSERFVSPAQGANGNSLRVNFSIRPIVDPTPTRTGDSGVGNPCGERPWGTGESHAKARASVTASAGPPRHRGEACPGTSAVPSPRSSRDAAPPGDDTGLAAKRRRSPARPPARDCTGG